MVEKAPESHPQQVFTEDTVGKITEFSIGARVTLYLMLDRDEDNDKPRPIINAGTIIIKKPLAIRLSSLTGPSTESTQLMPRDTAMFELQLTSKQRDKFELSETEFQAEEAARRAEETQKTDAPAERITATAIRAAAIKKNGEKQQRRKRFLAAAFLASYPEVLAGKTLQGEVIDPKIVNHVRFSVSLAGATTSSKIFSYVKSLS